MRQLTDFKLGRIFPYSCTVMTLLVLSVCVVGPAQPADFLSGDMVHLTNLHRIDGDVYAASEKVIIDGSINGDLLALGGKVTCSGEITGSQNILAESFVHTGRVDGSIRIFGMEAAIEGFVGRSILFCGSTLKIRDQAVVRKDVDAYGNDVEVAGAVMGNVTIEAQRIDISGQIDGDLKVEWSESIVFHPPAVIRGKLIYTGPTELDLEDAGVTVLGEITRVELEEDPKDQEAEEVKDSVLRFSRLFAAFFFGWILFRLCPGYFEQSFLQLRRRFVASLGTGLIAAAIIVISAALLVLAGITGIAGLILSSSDQVVGGAILLIFSTLLVPITSFTCVSGGVLLYAGKLLPAMLIGYGIIRIFKKQPKLFGKWQLLIGLAILTGLFATPEGGFVFYLAASIIGTGAIILGVRKCRRDNAAPSPSIEPPPAP